MSRFQGSRRWLAFECAKVVQSLHLTRCRLKQVCSRVCSVYSLIDCRKWMLGYSDCRKWMMRVARRQPELDFLLT